MLTSSSCEAPNLLLWLQESGLARVLLPELGLETVMRIDRPARPGDTLQVCVGFVDVPKGIYKLTELDFFASASLSSTDVDEAVDEEANAASLPAADDAQDSDSAAATAVDAAPDAKPLATASFISQQ